MSGLVSECLVSRNCGCEGGGGREFGGNRRGVEVEWVTGWKNIECCDTSGLPSVSMWVC